MRLAGHPLGFRKAALWPLAGSSNFNMIALTCPHCESALLVPPDCPKAQIGCPRCKHVLPNPTQPTAPLPGVFTAAWLESGPERGRKQRVKRLATYAFALLGSFMAALLLAILVVRGPPFLFLLPFGLPIPICLGAIAYVVQYGHRMTWRRGTAWWRISWTMITLFAFIGVAGMCGILVMLGMLATNVYYTALRR